MSLTAEMQAELRGAQRVYPVFEWELPTGTVKLSKAGVASASGGMYLQRVRRWGSLRYSIADWRNALQPVESTLLVSDTDRTLARIIRASRKEDVQRSVATIRLRSLHVSDESSDDDNVLFRGEVPEWSYALQEMSYSLRLRVADRPLQSRVPKLRVRRGDWPRAHESAIGQTVCQGLYGRFKSGGLGLAGGVLPTLYVDTVNYRYLVCHGWALHGLGGTTTRVWVNDVEQLSGWSVKHPRINGRLYTVIEFTSDQGADAVVTLDGNGYNTVGDPNEPGPPAGPLIERPTHCIAHWLANFVWNDYTSGAWASSYYPPADLNTLGSTDDLFEQWGTVCSRRIATEAKAEDILNEWASSEQVYPYWTSSGRLAFMVEDPGRAVSYPSDTWLRAERHDLRDWKIEERGRNTVDAIEMQHCYIPSENAYKQTLRVANPLLGGEKIDKLALPWSPAYVV